MNVLQVVDWGPLQPMHRRGPQHAHVEETADPLHCAAGGALVFLLRTILPVYVVKYTYFKHMDMHAAYVCTCGANRHYVFFPLCQIIDGWI